MFNPHTPEYRAEILSKWNRATVTNRIVMSDARLVVIHRDLYDPVQAATGVPWWLVGCFDCREEGFNHRCNLCNGDPIDQVTTHVPKGVGPFQTWSQGAIFAMHFDHLEAGDLVGWLIEAERYNGEGYHLHTNPAAPASPEPSPYLWSGTSIYARGKYRADGVWDPNLVDKQSGVAGIMKCLLTMGIDLGVSA